MRKTIKEVVNSVCPNKLLLQETKKEFVYRVLIRSIWELSFKDWVVVPFLGALRGLSILLDTWVASRVDVIEGFVSVTVLLNMKGKESWWITCAYGPMMQTSFVGAIISLWIVQSTLLCWERL